MGNTNGRPDGALYERLSPENAALPLVDPQTGFMFGVETGESMTLDDVLALAAVGKAVRRGLRTPHGRSRLGASRVGSPGSTDGPVKEWWAHEP